MGWKVEEPRTLLKSSDRTWVAGKMFNKVRPGDMICVYMKNIAPNPDGVYIVGNIRRVGLENGASFSWAIDRKMSAKVVVSPIATPTVRKFFPRSYGGSMQLLADRHRDTWQSLFGRGNSVFQDTPVIKVGSSAPKSVPRKPPGDPIVSREHGIKGERHVLALLKQRFPLKDGYKVEHVAASDPNADHDIAVSKGHTVVYLVEVKTRVGRPNEPVIISERELDRRKRSGGRHAIFVVYLDDRANIHST